MRSACSTDNRLRQASRGDTDEDRARYLAELVRSGRLPYGAIVLAAQAGYNPARLLEPVAQLKWFSMAKLGGWRTDDDDRKSLLESLEQLRDKKTIILLACDFAEHALLAKDPISRQATETTRRFVEGLATKEELAAARAATGGAGFTAWTAALAAEADYVAPFYASQTAYWAAREAADIESEYSWQRDRFIKAVLGET